MSDFYKKVSPGEKLNIPAAAYNGFVDAANATKANQLNATGGIGDLSTSVVLLKNSTVNSRERGDLLAIDGPIVSATDNINVFKDRITLKGILATATTYGRYAILLEPIAAGKIGRACIAGVCLAKVSVSDVAHTSAGAVAAATTLVSGISGTSSVLYAEAGTGVKWAWVRLGGDGKAPIWSPSMSWGVRYLCLGDANFYRTFASIQYVDDGNYWYQERSGARVTVGWLACPCDGILTGLTVSTNMGTPLRGALTYFSVCQAGDPADAVGIWHSQKLLAGAPVTGGLTYQASSDINARNAVYSSTDGTAAVTKGMLLALSAKCNCVAHTDYWRGATATFIIEKI